MPSPRPDGASTPITRSRVSPTRIMRPTALCPGKSSLRSASPITATAEARLKSSRGRKLPWPISSPRSSRKSVLVPTTVASRSRPPTAISELPTASGATRCTSDRRSSAAASALVSSRGVLLTKLPALTPPVSVRPGSTISRLAPSAENSFTT